MIGRWLRAIKPALLRSKLVTKLVNRIFPVNKSGNSVSRS